MHFNVFIFRSTFFLFSHSKELRITPLLLLLFFLKKKNLFSGKGLGRLIDKEQVQMNVLLLAFLLPRNHDLSLFLTIISNELVRCQWQQL